MPPKISIIIPVYNVEKYLRQCLDSVVNQTLQDIQIICVNDGSTDGSRAILQECADKDTRIEIIDQKNQGGGPARNAAYSHIRGKYTYFVDSDDWLDVTLCQQCWDKAEATEADCVMLRHTEHNPCPIPSKPFSLIPEIRTTSEERCEILLKWGATWQKVWRSDFLLPNNVKFSQRNSPSEDMLLSWHGTILANHIAVLDVPLYHYRIRQGSYVQTCDAKHLLIVESMRDIEKMLHETGFYGTYKDIFLKVKLNNYYWTYSRLSRSLKIRFIESVRKSLTETDREFYRTATKKMIPKTVRLFYQMVDGGKVDALKYHFLKVSKLPEQICRQLILKPLKKRLRAA